MNEVRKKGDWLFVVRMALAVLLVLAIVPGVYAWGYFSLGHYEACDSTSDGSTSRVRMFGSAWLATVYQPAGWVEGAVRGDNVTVDWHPSYAH